MLVSSSSRPAGQARTFVEHQAAVARLVAQAARRAAHRDRVKRSAGGAQ